MLTGEKILVGVTGGIAAYKTASLVRLLVKEGAEVKVIMTDHAKEFITPLTLATLSKNPILTAFFNPENGEWNSHIDLGTWASFFVIAPATANTIAKMACGVADNLLLTTYLSARCPVFVAPSMDVDMLNHQVTSGNLEKLKATGVHILDAPEGELASGLSGKGRMMEPEEILREITGFLKKKNNKPLTGRRVLINAGPTQEKIDPVRFISNYSSGRMGIALADAAAEYGAEVDLVLGPVDLAPQNKAIRIFNVVSASEMADECIALFDKSDIAILAAAVADFTPERVEERKVKRTDGEFLLRLKPTSDIAESLGGRKKSGQIVAGFALETHNEMANASKKLERKHLDLIIMNSMQDQGAGFGYKTNRITIIDSNNNIDKFELKTKEEAARDILDKIVSMMITN